MESEKNNKENYDEKIKALEKRIEELEKEKSDSSIVENIAGQFIPGLGKIVKTLEKASPEFRERIADTNEEIKHRLDSGWSSKPVVKYDISIRPLSSARKPKQVRKKEEKETTKVEVSEREPIIDIFKENDYISVIAELPGIPENEIETKLVDDALVISFKNFNKRVELPDTPTEITERTYKNGILQLKIKSKLDAN